MRPLRQEACDGEQGSWTGAGSTHQIWVLGQRRAQPASEHRAEQDLGDEPRTEARGVQPSPALCRQRPMRPAGSPNLVIHEGDGEGEGRRGDSK